MKQDYVSGCKCIRAWGGQEGVDCSQLMLKLKWKTEVITQLLPVHKY